MLFEGVRRAVWMRCQRQSSIELSLPEAARAEWWRLRFELVDPAHTELSGLEAGWVVHQGRLAD